MNIMMSRTTPPIGIIFGYRCETDDFDTYSSWLRLTQGMPEQQFFDLAYNVETTFSHGYQNWVDKKEFSQGIYYLHQSDITGEGAYDKRYYSPKDGKGYPVIKKGPKKYVVDPARGLLMFLVNIHSILLTKHIIQTSIMDKYLKGELTHALPFD